MQKWKYQDYFSGNDLKVLLYYKSDQITAGIDIDPSNMYGTLYTNILNDNVALIMPDTINTTITACTMSNV